MKPCAVPLLRQLPKCCSGSALLTQISSLQPVPGSSPLWESCSSTSRYPAHQFLLKLKWHSLTEGDILVCVDFKYVVVFLMKVRAFFAFGVCLGNRAGQGGREEGPHSVEPAPEHPHFPCWGEDQPRWHYCGLLHALALQTGLSSAHYPQRLFQQSLTSDISARLLSRRCWRLSLLL